MLVITVRLVSIAFDLDCGNSCPQINDSKISVDFLHSSMQT